MERRRTQKNLFNSSNNLAPSCTKQLIANQFPNTGKLQNFLKSRIYLGNKDSCLNLLNLPVNREQNDLALRNSED